MKSAEASTARVSAGRLSPRSSNRDSNWGTTKASITTTESTATNSKMAG